MKKNFKTKLTRTKEALKKLKLHEKIILIVMLLIVALASYMVFRLVYANARESIYNTFIWSLIISCIGMAYKHFKKNDDRYIFSVFLVLTFCIGILFSLLAFVWLAQCVVEMSPEFAKIGETTGMLLVGVMVIISSLISLFFNNLYAEKKDKENKEAHDYKWFGWGFYVDWVSTVATIFTVFSVIIVFVLRTEEASFFAYLSLIVDFYSIVLGKIDCVRNKNKKLEEG